MPFAPAISKKVSTTFSIISTARTPQVVALAARITRSPRPRQRKNYGQPRGAATKPPICSPVYTPMAKEKEYEVTVMIGNKIMTLPIKAASGEIAERLADRVIKRKNTKPSKVLSANEVKK